MYSKIRTVNSVIFAIYQVNHSQIDQILAALIQILAMARFR